MTAVVVDASVTAAWCFDDEDTGYARDVLSRAAKLDFFAPATWPLEMVNVLLAAERRKRISAADVGRALTLFHALAVEVDRPAGMQPFNATLPLARLYGLTSYDASYLELALREGMALATLDTRLRAAAKAAGVILF